jgi:hypothetical protein
LQSEVVSKASTGEPVLILDVSEQSDTSVQDACEKYPMIKVKMASGVTGWVFGKYIYKILNEHELIPDFPPVAFENRMLKLKICRNFGMGASDSEGITGCDEFYPILLVDTKTGESFLVSLSKPQNRVPSFHFWSLENDEGGMEKIRGGKIQNGTLVFDIFSEYMEGCGSYQVLISKSGGQFSGNCINFKEFTEEECNQLIHK